MNSNSNSPSPAAEPSRYFTVRFARFLGRRIRGMWRFIFSRRMVWTLAIFASLIVLLYQYENWNGARELAEARKKMIARIGTENYLDLLPDEVPEAENFYAIDEIKSWRVPDAHAAGGFRYNFPTGRLFTDHFDPPAVVDELGLQRLDLEGWAKIRIAAGKLLPPDESVAVFLFKELGDGNGILSHLAEGLKRPESQIIPCRKVLMAATSGMLAEAQIPVMADAFNFQNRMAIHLMAAALAAKPQRTKELAGIMLKLADGIAEDTTLVSSLTWLAQNTVTLKAMNPALQCASLREADFRQIQKWLGAVVDTNVVEQSFKAGAMAIDQTFNHAKMQSAKLGGSAVGVDLGGDPNGLGALFLRMVPRNWIDANNAFVVEMHLEHCGMGGEEAWRGAVIAGKGVERRLSTAPVVFSVGPISVPNPRRIIGCISTPAASGVWKWAAENLFRRRCAILTCALHRHRLAHGGFPEKLAGLDTAFLPEPIKDPAKAGAQLNYRKTEQGFLLWSVGEDRNDDGGDAAKDWIWRHEK